MNASSASFRAPYRGLALFFLAAGLLMGNPLRALPEPIAWTLDLPWVKGSALPPWLAAPVLPPRAFATLELPVTPPDATSSLFVTVYFTEKQGGFLRISWQDAGGNAQVLSDNFYEGTGMGNQRSLLIDASTLQGPGRLNLQCGEEMLGIQRVRLEWLENRNGVVSPRIADTLVTPANGTTQAAPAVNGQPPVMPTGAWHGTLVTVPVTDHPERIEQGVEFSVQLDALPAAGRLALREEGLPWGKHLVVWINQQQVGLVTPTVPDLGDDGFFPDPVNNTAYLGWRDGTLYLPVDRFKTGVNTILFAAEDDSAPATPVIQTDLNPLPLAVKDVRLQLVYPEGTAPSPSTETTSSPSPLPISDPLPVTAAVPAVTNTPPAVTSAPVSDDLPPAPGEMSSASTSPTTPPPAPGPEDTLP